MIVVKAFLFGGGYRQPGETVHVHPQARLALLSSGRAVDPKDAHAVRPGRGADARSTFNLTEHDPKKITATDPVAELRETADEKPEELKEEAPSKDDEPSWPSLWAKAGQRAQARGENLNEVLADRKTATLIAYLEEEE